MIDVTIPPAWLDWSTEERTEFCKMIAQALREAGADENGVHTARLTVGGEETTIRLTW